MRRCAPLSAARLRLLLLMACWMRLRVAVRAVRLAVSVVVSVAVARTAAASLPAARCRRLELAVLLRLLAARSVVTRPVVGFRVRARLALGVARLILRCRVFRLVVYPVCRRLLRRASWWMIPLGLVVVAVARLALPRRMMLAAVMGLPLLSCRFVMVCVVSVMLLAICCCWLRLLLLRAGGACA